MTSHGKSLIQQAYQATAPTRQLGETIDKLNEGIRELTAASAASAPFASVRNLAAAMAEGEGRIPPFGTGIPIPAIERKPREKPTVIQKLKVPGQLAVYVRLGADDSTRTITFKIPTGATQGEILSHGYAIDGNEATMEVAAVRGDRDTEPQTLFAVLRDQQLALVEWMKEKGFDVEFK